MNPETIDRIAEKLGVAADAARPIVELMIREYSHTHLLFGVICLVGVFFCHRVMTSIGRFMDYGEELDTVSKRIVLAMYIAGPVLAGFATHSLSAAISPTLSLLRMVNK